MPAKVEGIIPEYHDECWDRWGAKCNWEHMGRMAVLNDWPDIICNSCRDQFNAAMSHAKKGKK